MRRHAACLEAEERQAGQVQLRLASCRNRAPERRSLTQHGDRCRQQGTWLRTPGSRFDTERSGSKAPRSTSERRTHFGEVHVAGHIRRVRLRRQRKNRVRRDSWERMRSTARTGQQQNSRMRSWATSQQTHTKAALEQPQASHTQGNHSPSARPASAI